MGKAEEKKQFKRFKDLEFKPHYLGNGKQASVNFDNGYGVSVVMFDSSYGYSDGLWELAVLKNDKLCYSTHITDDVLGWLSEDKVSEVMIEVQKLLNLVQKS